MDHLPPFPQLAPALSMLESVRLLPGLRFLDWHTGEDYLARELGTRLGAMGKGASHAGRELPLPYENGAFDLVLSNLALASMPQPETALAECARLLPAFGQLVFTAPLPGGLALIQAYLEGLLDERDEADRIPALQARWRENVEAAEVWGARVEAAGFRVRDMQEGMVRWTFLNGKTLLSHPEVRRHLLPLWLEAAPVGKEEGFEAFLEGRLDRLALERGALRLDLPWVRVDAARR